MGFGNVHDYACLSLTKGISNSQDNKIAKKEPYSCIEILKPEAVGT